MLMRSFAGTLFHFSCNQSERVKRTCQRILLTFQLILQGIFGGMPRLKWLVGDFGGATVMMVARGCHAATSLESKW
jgi:hypothetical protein